MTITCFYSCDLCGLTKTPVEVPARGEEDVRVWMDATIRLISRDHDRRSPDCHPDRLHNLLIPMTGAAKIGGPAVQ